MRLLRGGDVSNYQQPFTPAQLDYVSRNWDFVVIGLQDAGKAQAFQRQFDFLHREYYMDRSSRDFSFCEPGSLIWCDVETGCMTTRDELDAAITRLTESKMEVGIYGNTGAGSIQDVLGNNADYSMWPLWYADYPKDGVVPSFDSFIPFNGWTRPLMWQWSNRGEAGIDCDLNIREATMWLAPGREIRATDNGFVFINKGVEVFKIGDAEQPGRLVKNFGGTDTYLRGLGNDNQWNPDGAARWSATPGD